MTAITMIQIDRTELQAMLDRAAASAIAAAAEASGELWSAADLARHYNVTVRTIHNMRHAGKLPPRDGSRWRKADILRWDRERSSE